MVYERDDLARPIIVPAKKSLSRNVILANLRTLGVSKDTYLQVIAKIK